MMNTRLLDQLLGGLILVVLCLPAFAGTELQTSSKEELPNKKISLLLHAEEFKEERFELIRMGTATLPSFKMILENNDTNEPMIIWRVLMLSGEIGKNAAPLLGEVQKRLTVQDASLRAAAVTVVAKIVGRGSMPIMIVMLNDADTLVKCHALTYLEHFGEKSSLLALDIWEKQTIAADKSRPTNDKWLASYTGLLTKLQEARRAIQARLDSSKQ